MKLRILIICLVALALNVYGQNPSTVLFQLGVKGVAGTGGTTNQGNCLVKTKADGTIDASLSPNLALTVNRLNQVRYIDASNGVDAVANGSIITPYKTFEYAINRNTKPVTFVFAPGSYTAPAADITSSNRSEMTLIGYDVLNTTIAGPLQFQTGGDVTVKMYNIWLSSLQQDSPARMTLMLYDHARVNTFTALNPTNSTLVVYRDPTIDWGGPLNSYLFITNTCDTRRIAFISTNSIVGLWTNAVYDASSAIHELPRWVTNWVTSQSYVTATVTNGLASTNWVVAQGYVTTTVTNGLATTNWVTAQGFLLPAATNDLASTNWVVAQAYVTASITNGMVTTNWIAAQGYLTGGTNGFTIPGNSAQRYSKFYGTVNSNTYPAWEISYWNGGFSDPIIYSKVYFSDLGWNFSSSTNADLRINGVALMKATGRTVTASWVDTNMVTNTQMFIAGQLTSWKTNGVEIP